MAALEPTRKRPSAFTIESIVGPSSSSSPKPSADPFSRHHVEDSFPRDQRSPSRKPASESGIASTPAAVVSTGSTSAGRHLELLARFATPTLTAADSSTFSTSGILGSGGGGGGMTLTEALLRAGGGHLPYTAAAIELATPRGNGFSVLAAATTPPRLQGHASTLDGSAAIPAALTLFRGSMWNPQDHLQARRAASQGWSPSSLMHPLTIAGVRPTGDHTYMQHPYCGK